MTMALVIIMEKIVSLTICRILKQVMLMMGMHVEGQRRLCFGKCCLFKLGTGQEWLNFGWTSL